MKKYREIMTALVLFMVLAVIWPVQAADVDVRRTGINEMAKYDATHCVVVDYDDFTETSTNTTETLTLTVDAKQSVEFRAMRLDAEFEADNNTTLQVKIGDGGDDDYLMKETHIGEQGTAVWWKLAGETGQDVDVTVTDTDVFVGLESGDDVTNEVTVVTGVTAAFDEATLGKKVYTSDDTVDFVFTPDDTADALADFTAGSMRVYLWISDPR